jgi:hypothetical protein
MLHDLLRIDAPIAELLPEENNSSSFDTVANGQGISALHLESYMHAADAAIDAAIQLDPKPDSEPKRWEYKESKLIRDHIDSDSEEHVIVHELEDAVVMFSDAPYLFRIDDFRAPVRGKYTIRAEVFPYQSKRPIVFSLLAGDYNRGRSRYLGRWDLRAKKSRTVEITVTLDRGEYIYPSPDDLMADARDGRNIWGHEADEYEGSGIGVKWLEVEGPLVNDWPPESTTHLLPGVEIKKLEHQRWERNRHIDYELVPSDDPKEQIRTIVKRLAPRAFRRPLKSGEGKPFADLAMTTWSAGHGFDAAIRTAIRGVITSPQFLFFESKAGELDDYALAARLAAFLWKSVPDDRLYILARKKQLNDPKELDRQVKRMLKDEKSRRFTNDLARQWWQLGDVNLTNPDARLYPEFDELLKVSIPLETQEFLVELIRKDLSTDNLVDSDFTFLNRRLAEHYGIPGVNGQHMRRVTLPENSHRGGIMTHASILKITANGTVTSPVRRGSWVLTNLLGTPPNPPPTDIGSIEPDTRGTTTIRESLAKHRNVESCAQCHQHIDPPGFALESYDVIGGYRSKYRCTENGEQPERLLRGRTIWEYDIGLPVDSSGVLADGEPFENIDEFKQLLLNQREQIARNVISNLITYATGAEIQFADRDQVAKILESCRESDFGMQTIIREVVQSRLFRNK